MDETTSIGVIELKTCIQAIVQCSPELLSRLGQDYTVYAYDYSEYDNPLVGQGMLSWALAAASPTPGAPAQQSRQLITGRVCKNILGFFANGVKETLEVKLRLVPVPTVLQSEYLNTMEKYRDVNKTLPTGFDPNEWTSFLQSNPNVTQMANKIAPPPNSNMGQRDGMSMEVVNQLLSPHLQQQPMMDTFNQMNVGNSGNEDRGNMTSGGKPKAASRPSSRASVKRPRGRKPKAAAAAGGNTSGYEEGTDGDEGSAPKKRAKVTKADKNISNSFATEPDSLRVAASTAGSLRLFRPIAITASQPSGPGNHLQEIPRAPTPVPQLPNQHLHRDRAPSQSALRRDSFVSQVEQQSRPHVSPYPPIELPEDQVRYSIESAGPSPERNPSPADTPPDIGSSPPLMRTRPPSLIRSSPPCPSSPLLPQMPRTDSGFMSGSLEDLFGEDYEAMNQLNEKEVELPAHKQSHVPRRVPAALEEIHYGFVIQEVIPGPVELLPTKMPVIEQPRQVEAKARSAISRAGSIMSEDGQVLPPLKNTNRSASRRPTMTQAQKEPSQRPKSQTPTAESQPEEAQASVSQPPEQQPTQQAPVQAAPPPPAPRSRPGSRMMVRTASMGSLTLPVVPASDPSLPPSNLQRSQTWSEAPHPVTEAPMPAMPEMTLMPPVQQAPTNPNPTAPPYSRTLNAKKAAIKQKLEMAIANGEMPPFCSNCGAIETPTWRKAWSQELKGEPGYYEYSDEPGRVTAIIILTRDAEGKPTSYQLIKKFLLPEENQDDYKEFLLCNRKLLILRKELWTNHK